MSFKLLRLLIKVNSLNNNGHRDVKPSFNLVPNAFLSNAPATTESIGEVIFGSNAKL